VNVDTTEGSGTAASKLIVNRPRFLAEARPSAYAAANGYLTLHAIISDTFKMPPAKLLLYVTIMMAAVQRVMRGGELPDDLRDATPLPDEHVRYISRRALAAATGLSRETVRRMVIELLEEGLLSEGPRGGLAAKAGLLAQPHVTRGLAALVTEYCAIANRMLRLGVLEPSDRAVS
jgi:hypothetical protein